MSYRDFVQTSLARMTALAATSWPDPGVPDSRDVDTVYSRTVSVGNPPIYTQVPYANTRQRNDKQLQQLCWDFLSKQKAYHDGINKRACDASIPVLQAILNDPSHAIDSVTDGQGYVNLFNAFFQQVHGYPASDYNSATNAFEKSLYDPMQAAQNAAQIRYMQLR